MITLTTEEAIKELSRYTKDCYTPKNREAHRMAIEALEMKARLENKQATSDKASKEDKRWIPVSEMMPENEVGVLVLCEHRVYRVGEPGYKIGKHVAMAFYTDGKTNTENSDYTWELWDTNADYDEEADAYIIPEGWWERVLYGEEFSAVDDFVTHWMPLPEEPEHEPDRKHTGCEWCEPGHEVCGTCERFFLGQADGCSTESTDEKCAVYVPADHCMKCGRKLEEENADE